jgi:addiction module RelE/StbE family toxin
VRGELEIRWLKRALANLESEAEYIARGNPAAAARIVKRIVSVFDRLRRFPASGRPGRVEGTRELIVSGTPYIVPYRVRDQEVQILRVFHAARKWPPN